VGVIVVFILGEMLWMPTSQAVAARLAPASLRGTYFGALAGVRAVWILFAGVAVVGAATGVAAVGASASSRIRRRSGSGCTIG